MIKNLFFTVFLAIIMPFVGISQMELQVDLSRLNGVEIHKENVMNYTIFSSLNHNSECLVKGVIQFKASNIRLEYSFPYMVLPGMNSLDGNSLATYTYSSSGLKDLFEIYKRLPAGDYEYCVTIISDYKNQEVDKKEYNDCIYNRSDDVFLINLVDPEDYATIYEFNPMLNWTVNYQFAAMLTYKIRVVEAKENQNNIAAITRNNPIYSESNINSLSQLYPAYAKPLQLNQPYVWTVDAYYKGLLLGGAEPWRFTIIEDSISESIPLDVSYYDISKYNSLSNIYALDTLKLKYNNYYPSDTLTLTIMTNNGDTVKRGNRIIPCSEGMNYIDIELKESCGLRHMKNYKAFIINNKKNKYLLPFRFVNMEYLGNKISKENGNE